jgi:mannosyl-3-phosphoglycerate phosphatase
LKWWKVKSDVLHDRDFLFLVFTDLDGTLLDHDSYRWDEAGPALSLCRRLGVPVILVSSKTRAEMNELRFEMGIDSPFISENGGAIFFPKETVLDPPSGAHLTDDLWIWPLGPAYPALVKALHEIRDDLGWVIRGFSDLTIEEIAGLTGLEPAKARLAAMREYDEPFILTRPEGSVMRCLVDAAVKRGLRITEGGRFYHLHGDCDKGKALQKLVRWYKKSHGDVKTIALGDSPNDFTMLKMVDYPVLVKSTRDYPGIEKEIAALSTTEERGPAGWSAAVTGLLVGKGNGGNS